MYALAKNMEMPSGPTTVLMIQNVALPRLMDGPDTTCSPTLMAIVIRILIYFESRYKPQVSVVTPKSTPAEATGVEEVKV